MGTLRELEVDLSTGLVGVTNACLLGLNTNKGQEIKLRLRTDDHEGFRKYHMIIETLLHELVHNVHSDHDEHFHALNRQLKKVR